MEDIEVIVTGKLEADVDFQASIADMSDDDKNAAIADKRKTLTNAEFAAAKKDAADAKKIAEDQKIRAEKAEGKLPKVEPKEEKDLSSTDMLAIMRADIHDDDIEEVKKAAKLLGKTIPEALKDSVLQGILASRGEERKTADALNHKNKRQGAGGKSDEEIVVDAAKGNVPEKGTKEADDLFWARRGGRRK